MKLTNDTLKILSNFAVIQANFKALPNKPILTMNDTRTLLARATLDNPFDSEMRVYDLNEFLAVHNFMNDPELVFSDDSVRIKDANSAVEYQFCYDKIMTYPDKEINDAAFDNHESEFTLQKDKLAALKKMAAILKINCITIHCDGKDIVGKIVNPKTKTHEYSVLLSEGSGNGIEYSFVFLISNLKILDGDYEICIKKEGISRWSNSDINLQYYIALENTSTYNNQPLSDNE